jgi:hypothetical protein
MSCPRVSPRRASGSRRVASERWRQCAAVGLPTPSVGCRVQRCPCSRYGSTVSQPHERCGASALRKPYRRLRTRGAVISAAHNPSCRCGRRVRPRAICSPHTTNLTHGGSPKPPPLPRAARWPPWRCAAAYAGRRCDVTLTVDAEVSERVIRTLSLSWRLLLLPPLLCLSFRAHRAACARM